MKQKTGFQFTGSKEDIADLRTHLTNAGFEEVQDNMVRASKDPVTFRVIFGIRTGIGQCIRAYLKERSKRMIIFVEDNKRLEIHGDHPPEKIEQYMADFFTAKVEPVNAEPTEPEPPHREMGFHTGMTPPPASD